MQPAISIQNLSKKYKLATSSSYVALRDVLTNAARNVFRTQKEKAGTFWALKDINLEIAEGERIGIIGHNGAGKSTLLKIISRITPPTTGQVILNGRVASLLEVGTGFHPELSGRENIYLNGSILGLKKKEIYRRLDEIIDFSGVEKFIDAPLKQYSSGMQLRLAFSVAAHLEAEILLIDEVLAVGDIEFQKKCIGKMEEISTKKGKTILFVSHNLGFVQNFCNKSVLLENASLLMFNNTPIVISTYLDRSKINKTKHNTFGKGNIELLAIELSNAFNSNEQLLLGYPARLRIKLISFENFNNLEIAFNIRNYQKELISHVTSLDKQVLIKAKKNEVVVADIILKQINFTPGTYTIDFFILNNDDMCWGSEDFAEFTVYNSEKAMRPNGFPQHVKTFTDSTWKVEAYENI